MIMTRHLEVKWAMNSLLQIAYPWQLYHLACAMQKKDLKGNWKDWVIFPKRIDVHSV